VGVVFAGGSPVERTNHAASQLFIMVQRTTSTDMTEQQLLMARSVLDTWAN
jgi:hypothetical protein